jgi:NitT/TauT family transport system substrate-binding protein
MQRSLRVLFVVVMASLVGIRAMAQDGLTDDRMLLTFIPNVQFSPFYMGIDEGYYADAGFNLTIEHLQEPEVVDLIAAGQANFGIVSGEQVILARAQSRDVVYVYEWFQQYPIGIVVPAGQDIASIADLSGRKVGLPGRFGATYTGLTTLLEIAGMSEQDIQLEEIGFNAPEVFCMGAVEASVIYVNNEPLQIRSRAQAGDCGDVEDVDVLTVASQVDLVSNGLIVSADMIENDPDTVAAMVGAMDQALQATVNNPARAYLVSMNYVENLPDDAAFVGAMEVLADEQDAFLATDPSREDIAASRWALYDALAQDFDSDMLTQFEVLLTTTDLWDAEQLGYSDLASWETMRDTLVAMEILEDADMNLEAAFTNEFLESDS